MLKLCSMAVSTFFFNDEQQHIKNLSLILIFIAHTQDLLSHTSATPQTMLGSKHRSK